MIQKCVDEMGTINRDVYQTNGVFRLLPVSKGGGGLDESCWLILHAVRRCAHDAASRPQSAQGEQAPKTHTAGFVAPGTHQFGRDRVLDPIPGSGTVLSLPNSTHSLLSSDGNHYVRIRVRIVEINANSAPSLKMRAWVAFHLRLHMASNASSRLWP